MKSTCMPIAKDPENRERHIQAVIESNKRRCGENHPLFGKKRPREVIEKILKTRKERGIKPPSRKGHVPWNKGKGKVNILKTLEKYLRYRSGINPLHVKLSKLYSGVPLSEEHRKKISESNKGKKFTEEHKNKLSEYRKGVYIGERCPAWKGGISFEPYCPKFNENFKERVREFFGRKCVLCGKTEEESNRKLCVHHVNYDKMVCCNDNRKLFVALCVKCHAKTNKNREYWETRFLHIIDSLYDGKCF